MQKTECEEITQASVAVTIMKTPGDKRLEKLFSCIYSLFHGSFLRWILSKYSHKNILKDKLLEDAKDAFENGILALYEKSKKNELNIKGSLKTVIYSFGLLQLLAFFKKEKLVPGSGNYIGRIDLFFSDDFSEKERRAFLTERETVLMEALRDLSSKQREILLMKFFYKLKSREIAEILNVTPGNVDNVSAKAYKKLREILITKYNFQKQSNGTVR